MIAIGADSGVDAIVIGSARVVMNDRLVVEIADKHGAVRADPDFDWAPPHVFRADEFRLFAAGHLGGLVTRTVRGQPRVMDHIDGRFGGEAVSYTHLRAHETGRNLVCRLL